jgi:hypothetical protein
MNLVTLHSALEATKGETKFRKNHFYRHVDYGNGHHIVNGEDFTDIEFKSLFESAISKVIKDWVKIGLLTENGERLTKTAFKRIADIHTYGAGKKTLKVWYFRGDKDCIYGFYPMQGTNFENQKECYQWYLDILNGNDESLDEKDVCFGNCGLPLMYSKLRIQ